MVFRWLRERRRREILETPFPDPWRGAIAKNLGAWRWLEDDERNRLERLTQVFVSEKRWEGCGGLVLDDEMRVTIAAQACLLILAHDHELYRKVESILVYPTAVVPPPRPRSFFPGTLEVVGASAGPHLGEAHLHGPVILAWDSALHGGRNERDGRNLVIHEFAHKLDMLDGGADGTPVLADRHQLRRWAEVFEVEFVALRRAVEQGRRHTLDPYGAVNEAEFFAVVSETFFEQGQRLRRERPELYGVLADFYRQDPAERVRRED
jgi:Mlc titration factor MtfA (ptsG expression regulator)